MSSINNGVDLGACDNAQSVFVEWVHNSAAHLSLNALELLLQSITGLRTDCESDSATAQLFFQMLLQAEAVLNAAACSDVNMVLWRL